MISFLLKRLLLLVPLLVIIVTLVFFMVRLIPGDPVDFILGEQAQARDRQALIEAQNFDKPIATQYLIYLKKIFKGDLGSSYYTNEPVTRMIFDRYPATLHLALTAMAWAILLALPLGILSALRKGQITDKFSLIISLLGISTPSFYLGPLLVLVFSIGLDWLPTSGREAPGSIILPSFVLGAAMAAILMRLTRASMLDILGADFLRTARAKGVSETLVVLKHALRPALTPVVAVIGLQMGTLLAGAIVTEKIFSWPGLGSLMLEAISRRDYGVVQACVLVISTSYMLINLLTDVLYGVIDPRVRLTENE